MIAALIFHRCVYFIANVNRQARQGQLKLSFGRGMESLLF